jgi:hypothetical protein
LKDIKFSFKASLPISTLANLISIFIFSISEDVNIQLTGLVETLENASAAVSVQRAIHHTCVSSWLF